MNNLGFSVVRQKGSHIFLRHPDGRAVNRPRQPRWEHHRYS
ncbi:MAG: type II toxin-antitoxin system HicA family toxin [Desulfofundulus sp.]